MTPQTLDGSHMDLQDIVINIAYLATNCSALSQIIIIALSVLKTRQNNVDSLGDESNYMQIMQKKKKQTRPHKQCS